MTLYLLVVLEQSEWMEISRQCGEMERRRQRFWINYESIMEYNEVTTEWERQTGCREVQVEVKLTL